MLKNELKTFFPGEDFFRTTRLHIFLAPILGFPLIDVCHFSGYKLANIGPVSAEVAHANAYPPWKIERLFISTMPRPARAQLPLLGTMVPAAVGCVWPVTGST